MNVSENRYDLGVKGQGQIYLKIHRTAGNNKLKLPFHFLKEGVPLYIAQGLLMVLQMTTKISDC